MSFPPVDYTVPPPQLDRPPPASTPVPGTGPGHAHRHRLNLPQYGPPQQRQYPHKPRMHSLDKSYLQHGPPQPYDVPPSPYDAPPPGLFTAPPPTAIILPPLHQPPPSMAVPPPGVLPPGVPPPCVPPPGAHSTSPYPSSFVASRLDPYHQQLPVDDYYTSCVSGDSQNNNNNNNVEPAYTLPHYKYTAPPLVSDDHRAHSMYDRYAKPSSSKDSDFPDKYKYSFPSHEDIGMEKFKAHLHDKTPAQFKQRSPVYPQNRERFYRDKFEEKHVYDRMRIEQERRREYELKKHESRRFEFDSRRSPSRKRPSLESPTTHQHLTKMLHSPSRRSPSRRSPSHRSPSRRSPSRRSPSRRGSSRRSPSRRSPSRRSPSRRSSSCMSPVRSSSSRRSPSCRSPSRKRSCRSPSRRSPSHSNNRSSTQRSHSSVGSSRSPSRHSFRSRSRDSCASGRSFRQDNSKPMTDREKILAEYRKNYCRNSKDLLEKMEKWSEEHDPAEDMTPKTWYRSSPATLYYKPLENRIVEQTPKLEKICVMFRKELIERGRAARPEFDEMPPPQGKAKSCRARLEDEESGSSSSSGDEMDDAGLQGYSDRIMVELQRKQSHPRRLHPEMWFNTSGEMNGGPLCRCSVRARRHGMRHGVYAGEDFHPRCNPKTSNIDKLYHYRITVSPPTNFLIKAPTIIGHDEHEFLFSGFSMFTHNRLTELPTCKVIRFNIEYTILYVEEPAPENFSIEELDLFEEFIFVELLELVDLDLGRGAGDACSQFHFMPRFVRYLADGGCEVLSMCEVMRYLLEESGMLVPPEKLYDFMRLDHYSWQKFVDGIKGMIVTYPGKKPCSVRVDQLDRSPPFDTKDPANREKLKNFYPEIVHFGVRPPQLSYAGRPEYQKAWRYYVKYRHLIANMSKPTPNDRRKLASKQANLQEMRTQSKMKRDVTVALSSQGFYTTGLMCDVVQHAMLIPVLVRHLRFHKSLDSLEARIGYVFKQRALLQTALTHPSYRENFGTNPDHARNSLTNCGIRQPEYGDRRIHYTRKKGIVTLINIMSRFGKRSETESAIKHNERLEFLGDAVVEFLSSIHLFKMFPGLAEGGLATYRAAIVQNQHLAQLAKNIGLEQYMLYAHGSDLCRDVVMRHAMANCFEALMGALFLDGENEDENLQVADRVFSLALWHNDALLLSVWSKERVHPLQEQEPLGDRKYIKHFEFLQKLTKFEDSIGLPFKHIRLLARAFTDRSVGFTHLTLGSNQRLEFLGDTVLQLVVSGRLYKHFPEHHEGHLSLLRSSLVNNRTQSMVCDDLNMSAYAIYNNPKAKPTTKKHKADLLEAFLGALYIDKSIEYCEAFCNACLFPRLQEFIMNQDWNDPKSKLQQCCLTLRSMEGGEPHIPFYKVIECLGPTNTRVYTVAVYFRGVRLAAGRGHSIQEAEMSAAEEALNSAHELFPQLDHQRRVIAKSMKHKKHHSDRVRSEKSLKRRKQDEMLPRAYRSETLDSSDESVHNISEPEAAGGSDEESPEDSGLDSDSQEVSEERLGVIKVTSLLTDMERLKRDLIKRNEYDKLKEKAALQTDGEDESDE